MDTSPETPAETDLPSEPITPQTSLAPASSEREARPGLAAINIGAGFLAFYYVTRHFLPNEITVVWGTTLFSLLLTLLFTVYAARAIRAASTLAINLLVSGILALPFILIPILAARFPGWPGWQSVGPPYMRALQAFHRIEGLNQLLLMWFAASVGVLLSRLVREMKLLLPMAVVLAFVDLYAVFGGGVVQQAVSEKNQVAQKAMQSLTVSLPHPMPDTAHGAMPLGLAVGFADLMIIALFFACFARFGIPSRATLIVLCVILILYMGACRGVQHCASSAGSDCRRGHRHEPAPLPVRAQRSLCPAVCRNYCAGGDGRLVLFLASLREIFVRKRT